MPAGGGGGSGTSVDDDAERPAARGAPDGLVAPGGRALQDYVIDPNLVTIERCVGSGCFGDVYQGRFQGGRRPARLVGCRRSGFPIRRLPPLTTVHVALLPAALLHVPPARDHPRELARAQDPSWRSSR